MIETKKTGSARYQGSIMHRVCIIVCITYCTLSDVVTRDVLFVYLFKKNKSYGSKKLFTFILWCTRKSVGHSSHHFSKMGYFRYLMHS
jgi:hypothetical protein